MADAPAKTPLLKNKKVLIAVAVVVLAGLAYYLYKRNQANAATAATGTTTAADSTAPVDNGLGSAGLGPSSGTGTDTSGLDTLAAALTAEQTNSAQLTTANNNLYGSIITGQEGLIADLAGSVQTVSTSAIDQLGYVAGAEAGALSTLASGSPSAAAPPAPSPAPYNPGGVDIPAQQPPADGGGGSGVYVPPTPASGTFVDPALITKPASTGGPSGAQAVKVGAAKVNTQAAKNARAG
jgi:hypothetical protein